MTYEIGGLEWRRDVASLRDDQCSSPLVVPSRGYNYSYGSCLIPRLREGEWEKRGGVWRPKEILDFNYDNAFKLEFMQGLMSLPLSVRHTIYAYVALSWCPSKEYPSPTHAEWTSWDHHGYYKFALARRPKNNQQLDYLKDAEYRNLHGFVLALETFEGTEDPHKSTMRDLGVLNDFLGWFWDNIVMYIHNVETLPGENWPMHRLYNSRYKPRKDGFHQWLRDDEQKIHERITHLALETRGLDKFKRKKPQLQEEFLQTCEFIRTYLPNVASVFLTVRIRTHELQYLMKSEDGHMYMWVKATASLPVRKEFTVKLEVTDWEGSPEDLAGLEEKGTASLTRLLMPKTLRKGLVTTGEKRASSKKGSVKKFAEKRYTKKKS